MGLAPFFFQNTMHRPTADPTTCGKCRKKLQPGDRITQAFIIDRVGVNPNNLASLGAYLHEEFELVHIDCHDPDLAKGIITL